MLEIFIVLITLSILFTVSWRLLKWFALKRLQVISGYFHHIVDLSQSKEVIQSIPIAGYSLHDAMLQVGAIPPDKHIQTIAKLYSTQAACNQ